MLRMGVFRCARRCLVTEAKPSQRMAGQRTLGTLKLRKIKDYLTVNSGRLKTAQRRGTLTETEGIVEQLLNSLNSKEMDYDTCSLVDRIMRDMSVVGMYHERSFDMLAKFLTSETNEMVMRLVVPAFVGLCSRVRYYNPSFLDTAGQYTLNNVRNLDYPQLACIVHGMAQLNHPIPSLIPELEKVLLEGDTYLKERRLAWMVVWAGMILSEYPSNLMQVMLMDSYIKGICGFHLTIIHDLFVCVSVCLYVRTQTPPKLLEGSSPNFQ